MMFAVKAGTRHGAAGRRSSGRRHRSAAAADVGVARGQPGELERFTDRRAARCSSATCGSASLLTIVYAIIGAAYIAFVFGPSISQALDSPLTVTLASLSVLVAITLVNFLYLLMQIVMAAENCGVLEAVPHVARLLRRRCEGAGPGARRDPRADADGDRRVDSRDHAARLDCVSCPFIGLAALPLQVFAWLVRGVVFQFVGLTGVATYLRMHFALQSAMVASAHAVGRLAPGHARMTLSKAAAELPGIRDPAHRRAQRDDPGLDLARRRLSRAGRVSVGRPRSRSPRRSWRGTTATRCSTARRAATGR